MSYASTFCSRYEQHLRTRVLNNIDTRQRFVVGMDIILKYLFISMSYASTFCSRYGHNFKIIIYLHVLRVNVL